MNAAPRRPRLDRAAPKAGRAGSDAPSSPLVVSALGTGAMLFDADGGASPDPAVQHRIWAIAEVAELWPGVRETMPGMNNLLVVFDDQALVPEALAAQVQQAWLQPSQAVRVARTVELPVVYGGAGGPDLAALAEHAGLDVHATAQLHAQATYTVFFLGAHPGFAYLGGLDPRLHMPRRAQPRPQVRAGTVAIGGAQTGVVAQVSPSGWQLLGVTDAAFFDPLRVPPALLAPGDQVRFRVEKVEA